MGDTNTEYCFVWENVSKSNTFDNDNFWWCFIKVFKQSHTSFDLLCYHKFHILTCFAITSFIKTLEFQRLKQNHVTTSIGGWNIKCKDKRTPRRNLPASMQGILSWQFIEKNILGVKFLALVILSNFYKLLHEWVS